MNKSLSIGGVSLSTYNAYYDGSEWFRLPAKEVENVPIPGRNGDLTIEGNRFNNISIPFNFFIPKNFRSNYSNLMNYLYSRKGYQRIESDEEPDVFRMGQIKSDTAPNMGQYGKYGSFIITIDFMPQKWLKTGETEVTIVTPHKLTNPTRFDALPLMKVEGTGTIKINSDTLVLSANTGTTIIDCEMQDVYEGTTNRNPDITMTGDMLPALIPGENNIEYSGGITSLKVIPRWWRL